MSDTYLFCVCLIRDVLLLLSTILYDLWVKLYEYLMRRCEKACQKAWPPVNIKLQSLICNTYAIQKSLKVRYLFLKI